MWDNRATKRNPKAPDFKCRKPGDQCDGVIWPPRAEGDAGPVNTGPAAADVPPCPKCKGVMWDNRQQNAERLAKGEKQRPDFACKDRQNCDGVIWPPRDANAPGAAATDDTKIVAPKAGEPACPKCGNAMWDNRVGKKNHKGPDFKCKRKTACDGVIWPPKDGEKSPYAAAAAPAQSSGSSAPSASSLNIADGDIPF
jgi:ssDNA-binding Zn-finger/Zn-ribbon topoisomerase 1